ncbi:hypothetical protein AKJ09_11023 [Labilithrix luteola]|uniref:Uncharacterized protein n=1 Tax=Labilithrix luteola TaxID=1391654 RepID=A0A0K1QG10_9BACT|nr:hypothetical protein [Labilithrix luteola]AKV04360.1 hypothetical protein AKJ09_11023 [Labilithrix luteola]
MRLSFVLATFVLTACAKDQISPDPSATNSAKDAGPHDPNKPSDPSDPSTPSNPSTPGEDTNVSGSRLKRRVYKGADGSQQFAGWFDSERNENCDIHTAADGKLRCLPASFVFANSSYFSDSNCAFPIYIGTKGCTPPAAYSVDGGGQTCNRGYVIRPIGTAFTSPNFYLKNGAACVSQDASAWLSAYDLYSTGAEIPASSFFEVTESHL